MRADQMAEAAVSVSLDHDLIAAALPILSGRAPGVVVIGSDGQPYGLLSAWEVLQASIPVYVRQDPCLAHVLEEDSAEDALRSMLARPVRTAMEGEPFPALRRDATVLEVASAMAEHRTPLVVVEKGNRGWGVVTAATLLRLLSEGMLAPRAEKLGRTR